MTLPESETVDHPRKREEMTQSTELKLERTITTPQYN